MPIKAKQTLKKAEPYVPLVVKKQVDKAVKSVVEKSPKRLQAPIKDEVRRVGGMKVR